MFRDYKAENVIVIESAIKVNFEKQVREFIRTHKVIDIHYAAAPKGGGGAFIQHSALILYE